MVPQETLSCIGYSELKFADAVRKHQRVPTLGVNSIWFEPSTAPKNGRYARVEYGGA
jgi:hypothetical protein